MGIAFVVLLLVLCMAFGVLCQKLLPKTYENEPAPIPKIAAQDGIDEDFDRSGA